mgnify:CR=1 FL=1
MGSKHKDLCFKYCGIAQGHMHSHLVTVEVGVECRTYQGMKLYSLTLDKFGLEGLYTQPVKGRGTVQ